jgi:hypothetical protein
MLVCLDLFLFCVYGGDDVGMGVLQLRGQGNVGDSIWGISVIFRGRYFDMEPGRRPPIAPSRPRVPTINESGE